MLRSDTQVRHPGLRSGFQLCSLNFGDVENPPGKRTQTDVCV